ncbi:AbrB/MazE/SpoVT family DNA-binding domain-containing protein [Lacticaseibacillus sharpeae]|uniref:ABC transporter permease n=1 Tax=Lacticaseibacillus sharpeae JCM 1186 = DSM 20505 TaxID=1291052 RepID=A0A0R1ZIS3_9LACO|nr:DUF998 domain-containing protein [Lacticaseibacillus sharpeae]KRM54242.1 ABC transporter permease [Lacticaseibacillus sharpeae JCM 1186 = DSM 20505]
MGATTKPVIVRLPAEIQAQLGVKSNTPMQLSIRNGRIIIQHTATDRINHNRLFLIWPLIAALITTIGSYIYWLSKGLTYVPLSGDVSVASFIIGIGVVTGVTLFTAFFIRSRNDDQGRFSSRIYWRNLPVIIISFTIMLGLALLGITWLLGTLFPGATFDAFTAALILLLLTFIADAFMVAAAITINATILIQLLTTVIITGVVVAMAANGERRWWQHNLSFLGTNMASNSWQFNLTLIITALLMVALIDYIFVTLRERYPENRRLIVLRILLTLISLEVACVGIFPNNAASHFLHDQAAGLLIMTMVVLIIGVRWLLPNSSREFLITSYVVAVLLLLLDLGFRFFKYPSLTSFEIQAFILAFGWLLLLFNRLQALMAQGVMRWPVVIRRLH